MTYARSSQRSGNGFLIAGVAVAFLCVGAILHAGTASAAGTGEAGPNLEVHIANNGFVLVRNATIASISGTVLTAEITWGSSTLTWAVRTDKRTEFVRSDGEIGDLSDLEEGDTVSITGELDPSVSSPTIIAETVRKAERKAPRPVVALGVADVGGDAGAAGRAASPNGFSSAFGGLVGLGLILGGCFIAFRSQKERVVRIFSRFGYASKKTTAPRLL